MGAKTGISWTDATWNCIRGCSMAPGSETGGCLNCYAARLNARNLPELRSPKTGEPFARIIPSGPRWTGKVEVIESMLDRPVRWKKGKRIFVNSMSDLFHEELTYEQIDLIFNIMEHCPQHTFQVLTKRPERMLAYMQYRCVKGFQEYDRVPKNVWLGVSVENQKTADARIPLLLRTHAAKRFVSYEPALEYVDFTELNVKQGTLNALTGEICSDRSGCVCEELPQLDQLIVGGESGPGARGFDLAWAESLVEPCGRFGVALFVKQLGAKPYFESPGCGKIRYPCDSLKGDDPEEWPAKIRVQQYPRCVDAARI